MSRRGNEAYDYKEESTASFGPAKRTRRRINQQNNDDEINESPGKKHSKFQARSDSNDKHDYNVDESINEDSPTINKNSYVFNPPINEKKMELSIALTFKIKIMQD